MEMSAADQARLGDEVRQVFESGVVFEKSDEDLDRYLQWLAIEPVPNELIRHSFIIRAQIINTIKTDRYIRKADRVNMIHTWIMIGLAIFTAWLTFETISTSRKIANDAGQQTQELVEAQNHQIALQEQLIKALRTKRYPLETPVKKKEQP